MPQSSSLKEIVPGPKATARSSRRIALFWGALVAIIALSLWGFWWLTRPVEGPSKDKGQTSQGQQPSPPRPELVRHGGMPGKIDQRIARQSQSYGNLHVNRTVDGHPLTIADKVYQNGFGTHAASRITLDLEGKFSRFAGAVGADMEAGGTGTMVFKIIAGSTPLFQSPIVKRGEPALRFDVKVPGVLSLDLVVEDGGDNIHFDHADWVDLKLE